jgi:hypothetical protein
MKKSVLLLSVLGLAGSLVHGQNLLSNGDFELPADGTPASDWEPWFWGNGWANTEQPTWGSGSWQISVGAAGDGGGGYYQIIPGTAGATYTLSLESGADAWWLPTGTMTMFFLDDANTELDVATRNTVDPAVYGENYDIPHPWESYSLTATAPAGTTKIKVELAANNATGSVGFDNVVLLVPEPTTAGLLALGSVLLLGYRSRRSAS